MADNTIALGVRVPTFDFGQITQNRANVLGMMADLEKQRRAQEAQNAFATMVAAPGFNPADLTTQTRMVATGAPGATEAVRAAQQARTSDINAQNATREQQKQALTTLGSHLYNLINDPTDEGVARFRQNMMALRLPKDMLDAELSDIERLPVEQRGQIILQRALSDPNSRASLELIAPKPVSRDLGDRIEVVDENPYSRTFGQSLQRLTKGVAPSGLQSLQTSEGIMAFNPQTGGAAPVTRGEGIPAARGAAPTAAPAAAPGVFGAAIDRAVSALIPGARVSSAERSAAANAAAGGVPTSFHLTNNARDYDNFPGMTLAQGAATLRQALEPQGFQVIYGTPDHRDHVHVEPGPGLAASMRPPAAGASAPGAPTAAGAPIMPYDSKNAGKDGPLLSPQDRQFLNQQRTSLGQLNNLLPRGQRFLQLNRKFGTGVGQNINPLRLVDANAREMQSIVDLMTPAMRQGLPGAASDKDVAMFRSATVGVNKPGRTNQNVVAMLEAGTRRQRDYVAFMEQYAKDNGNLLGAQEEWDTYAAAVPMFEQSTNGNITVLQGTPWRQFFNMEQNTPARPTPGAPAAAPGAPAAAAPRKLPPLVIP